MSVTGISHFHVLARDSCIRKSYSRLRKYGSLIMSSLSENKSLSACCGGCNATGGFSICRALILLYRTTRCLCFAEAASSLSCSARPRIRSLSFCVNSSFPLSKQEAKRHAAFRFSCRRLIQIFCIIVFEFSVDLFKIPAHITGKVFIFFYCKLLIFDIGNLIHHVAIIAEAKI